MTNLLALDRSTARRYDADGHMHVDSCNISKANVCDYYGREVPDWEALGLDAAKVYKVFRDPEELRKAAASFAGKPLLLHHIPVTADDHATDLVVGTVGTDIAFDGTYLTAPLSVWTREAILVIESKKQVQLSCGYRYTADVTPGVSPEGVAFDIRMVNISGNHVALVHRGRAGPDVVVADETFRNMKRPKILAIVASILGLQPQQAVALDDALDAELKAKAKPDDEDDELTEDEKAAAAKALAGKTGMDEAAVKVLVDAAIATAAADTARSVAAVHALYAAREAVAPKVGVVTLDSAEAVYRFALDKAGVDHKAVTAEGLPALYDAASKAAPAIIQDTAPAARLDMLKIFPGLENIRKG